MDAAERLCAAVLPIVPICDLHDYDGDAETYCTYRCDYDPALHAGGRPDAIIRSFLLDLHLPQGKNPGPILGQLSAAIAGAGFTWPAVEDGTIPGDPQHYVLTFEGMDDG